VGKLSRRQKKWTVLAVAAGAVAGACNSEDNVAGGSACAFCGDRIECHDPGQAETLVVVDVKLTAHGCVGQVIHGQGTEVEVNCQSGEICFGTACRPATIDDDTLNSDDTTCYHVQP